MSTPAVAPAAPVHTVTLVDGQVISEAMTATERHNAVAKSLNLPVAGRPPGVYFGPEIIHHHAQAAKAPPPSQDGMKTPPVPAVVPPQGTPEERARDEAGKFTPATPSGPVTVDQAALDKLNADYRALSPKQREARRGQYEGVLRQIYEGKTLAELQAAKTTPPIAPTGEWEKPADVAKITAELAADTREGFVDISKLRLEHTSGYTLPAVPAGTTFNVSALTLLAQARAAGVDQAVVTKILQAQMKVQQ
jgi:hypothetical protein